MLDASTILKKIKKDTRVPLHSLSHTPNSYWRSTLHTLNFHVTFSIHPTKPGLCNTLEGWDGKAGGREVQERGDIWYLWLIHVDAWQKLTQFCKAIIFQLKGLIKIKI